MLPNIFTGIFHCSKHCVHSQDKCLSYSGECLFPLSLWHTILSAVILHLWNVHIHFFLFHFSQLHSSCTDTYPLLAELKGQLPKLLLSYFTTCAHNYQKSWSIVSSADTIYHLFSRDTTCPAPFFKYQALPYQTAFLPCCFLAYFEGLLPQLLSLFISESSYL